tara:strand:+ start:112 stop:852 length:741 start_codon:yes stop_codon:yes gene_type:complete
VVIERGTLKQVERKGRDAQIPWLIKFMFIKENGEQLSIGNKNWFGSYSDTAPGGYPHNGQGAFNLKAWEEREIPNPTVWEIEFGDEVSETVKGVTYQNIYVVSAKTISQSQPQQRSEEPSGGTSWPSPATGNSWTSALDSTGKSIIRQVAFKGARKTVYEAHVQAVLVESILKEIKNAIESHASANEDHVPVSELRDIIRPLESCPEGVVSPHLLTPDVAKLTNDYESIILGTYSDDADELEGEEI